METSILQKIKKKAGTFMELQLLKTGRVTEVRAWEGSPIIELDLYLPFADIKRWNEVPYIKFKVGDLCFRDYTPFGWDAETASCSLLIDTAHEGPGTYWAKHLKAGDCVQYLKTESTHQSPHPTDFVVALGDASSLGHMLALQQLTLPVTRFDGAVLLDDPQTGQQFKDYFRSPVNTLTNRNELIEWLVEQSYCSAHTWFYLAGNQYMVCELRRLLKSLGHPNIRIKEFWS